MFHALILAAVLAHAKADVVEVPFHLRDEGLVVDVVVNGKNASLVFDTGFAGAVHVASGINVGKPNGSMGMRDFVGEFEAPTVKLDSLKIGGKALDAGDEPIIEVPMEHLSLSYGTHVDGLLGLAPFIHSVFQLNFEKSKFVFFPNDTDLSKRVPDNKKTFLVKMLPIGVNSIELTAETPDGKPLTLALDTGNSYYSTTHKDVLERVGLWKESNKISFMSESMVASGPVDSWALMLKSMKIFGVPVEKSVWDIIDLPSGDADSDGTVGFQFLKNFNITVDMVHRWVWLECYTNKFAEPPIGETGILAAYDRSEKRMRVFHITPGSPAEKDGVKEGDFVIEVDGKDVTHLTFDGVRKLMQGPLDSVAKVVTSQEGLLQRHDLKRAYLFNVLP